MLAWQALTKKEEKNMEFLELCEKRFSARKYTSEQVSEADFEYIMQCVRVAPSAVNFQPWKFVAVRSEEAKARLRECYNREWFATAPMYVICENDMSKCWVRKVDGKQHGDIDVAIAAEHLCLAATERGLGTCWVCNFDVERVKQQFCAEGFEPVVILPIGHIAPDCSMTEKKRVPLADLVEEV